MKKLVILDRDGTINKDTGFTYRVEELQVLPGVIKGLILLQRAGFRFTVVTNQSGIGRGIYTEKEMHCFNEALSMLLSKYRITIDRFYFCPHTPDEGCRCRKPSPLLVEKALKDAGADPRNSFMIGDRIEDGLAGKRAGVTTILVKTGPKTPDEKNAREVFDHICENFEQAAEVILNGYSSFVTL